jgi:hypothetical protein
MLVAIRTPGNMWHLILRNPGFGNTGNDGDGNNTRLEEGSSVAHTLISYVLAVTFVYDETKAQGWTPAYGHKWPLG